MSDLVERLREQTKRIGSGDDYWPDTVDYLERAADRIEDLEGILRELIALADSAMADANRDGGEYDRAGELREARAALGE